MNNIILKRKRLFSQVKTTTTSLWRWIPKLKHFHYSRLVKHKCLCRYKWSDLQMCLISVTSHKLKPYKCLFVFLYRKYMYMARFRFLYVKLLMFSCRAKNHTRIDHFKLVINILVELFICLFFYHKQFLNLKIGNDIFPNLKK